MRCLCAISSHMFISHVWVACFLKKRKIVPVAQRFQGTERPLHTLNQCTVQACTELLSVAAPSWSLWVLWFRNLHWIFNSVDLIYISAFCYYLRKSPFANEKCSINTWVLFTLSNDVQNVSTLSLWHMLQDMRSSSGSVEILCNK